MLNNAPDLPTIIRDHVADAERHEERARYHYAQAATIIEQALVRMNQREVADSIGKSTTWVSRLLKWFRAGCPQGTIFDGQGSRPKKKATKNNWWSSVGHTPQCGRVEHQNQLELIFERGEYHAPAEHRSGLERRRGYDRRAATS